ncbi:MAG: segregation/condensation protein A [Dictyoglomus sp.]|nr:segregation/condensation protein A [Dictyoglomus sp.]MCX7942525.1 segregation/condensation protein A [Dictyoglomaceae bacterium]MDW8188763.1 segregation/condensation protein A [Dictyoglomus sp.]
MYNPFYILKEIISEEINPKGFPLKRIIEQYQSLDKERWKDLDLTTYFLDVIIEVLEIKIKTLFPQEKKEREKTEKNILVNESKWKKVRKYLEEKEEKGIRVFFREKNNEIFLDEKEKINITQIYLIWLKSKENKINTIDFPREIYKIEDKMEDILKKTKNKIPFSEIVRGLSKIEIIYYFLALCELIKQGKIKVYQKDFYDEIILERNFDYARV